MSFNYEKIAQAKAQVKQAGKFDFLKALFKSKPTNLAKPVATQAANPNSGGVLQFVKNTFKPGPAVLKKEIGDTARIYKNTTYRDPKYQTLPDGSNVKRLPELERRIDRTNYMLPAAEKSLGYKDNFFKRLDKPSGLYGPFFDTAMTIENLGAKRPVMRHELTHASQSNPVLTNSMSGLVNRLESSEGPWRHALGRFLGEMHANAAMSKSIPGKIYRGTSFALNPAAASVYAQYPGYGGLRYAAIHGGLSSPTAAGFGYGSWQAAKYLADLEDKQRPTYSSKTDMTPAR